MTDNFNLFANKQDILQVHAAHLRRLGARGPIPERELRDHHALEQAQTGEELRAVMQCHILWQSAVMLASVLDETTHAAVLARVEPLLDELQRPGLSETRRQALLAELASVFDDAEPKEC